MTAVVLALDREAPFITVRPRTERVPRFLLNQVARLGGHHRSVIDALFASIETGDTTFDAAFRVLGDDEAQVRVWLGPAVRACLIENRHFFYEIGSRHAVVAASRLVFGDELEALIKAADTLADALG